MNGFQMRPAPPPPPYKNAPHGKADGNQYNVRWNNYKNSIIQSFEYLLRNETFVDVTLACEGETIKAHKVVLSACSPYFQKILAQNPCQHPIMIMPSNIRFADLKYIIDFMYKGEIDVVQEHLDKILEIADLLQIKGFREVTDPNGTSSYVSVEQTPQTNFNGSRGINKYHPYNKVQPVPPKLPVQSRYMIPRVKILGDGSAIKSTNETSTSNGKGQPESNNDTQVPSGVMNGELNVTTEEEKEREEIYVNGSASVGPTLSKDETTCNNQTDGQEDDRNEHASTMNPQAAQMEVSDDFYGSSVSPELLNLVHTSPNLQRPDAGPEPYMDGDDSNSKSLLKTWTEQDMEAALDALKTKLMSLTRASQTFGIPSTTLWQRAQRSGIETTKKDPAGKTWSEGDLLHALEAMRNGSISANKASKEYGIPSSTLYKIAKKEGIKLAAPFNSSIPNWTKEDLQKAFEAIRSGMSVMKAASEFGIPSGTLYGKCKKEGIELKSKEQVNWSEDNLSEAIDVVKAGEMSINQAALHFNVPYSTLYGRCRKLAVPDGEVMLRPEIPHVPFFGQEVVMQQVMP
ncbi:unnamed protein product [Darwinula stevensoni]|uniref:Pipsqueak n=1 Tax=Darwinula stevensoni TaxID=69355 RepID=A0A7R9A4M3_9CRUS|nr:unnamed protein product [Darwinula stevensoni]CAG0884571.1 unnamed protein product [Darwinula stevensoni]